MTYIKHIKRINEGTEAQTDIFRAFVRDRAVGGSRAVLDIWVFTAVSDAENDDRAIYIGATGVGDQDEVNPTDFIVTKGHVTLNPYTSEEGIDYRVSKMDIARYFDRRSRLAVLMGRVYAPAAEVWVKPEPEAIEAADSGEASDLI